MKTAVINIATEKQRPTFSSLISNPPGQLDRLHFFIIPKSLRLTTNKIFIHYDFCVGTMKKALRRWQQAEKLPK